MKTRAQLIAALNKFVDATVTNNPMVKVGVKIAAYTFINNNKTITHFFNDDGEVDAEMALRTIEEDIFSKKNTLPINLLHWKLDFTKADFDLLSTLIKES